MPEENHLRDGKTLDFLRGLGSSSVLGKMDNLPLCFQSVNWGINGNYTGFEKLREIMSLEVTLLFIPQWRNVSITVRVSGVQLLPRLLCPQVGSSSRSWDSGWGTCTRANSLSVTENTLCLLPDTKKKEILLIFQSTLTHVIYFFFFTWSSKQCFEIVLGHTGPVLQLKMCGESRASSRFWKQWALKLDGGSEFSDSYPDAFPPFV